MRSEVFHRQIGCLPVALFCAGLFWSLYFLGAIFSFIYMWLIEASIEVDLVNMGLSGVIRILGVFGAFLFFSWFGVIFADTFPAVRVDETGLFVKNLLRTDHFAWEEVRLVTGASIFKNTKAVILAPRGNSILNFIRYYPYIIHSLIAGTSPEPVVLLSENLNRREEILKEIGDQLRKKITSQTSLPLKD